MYYLCIVFLFLQVSTEILRKKIQNNQNCDQNTSQLINLLTLACDNVANVDEAAERDLCVQCFRAASRANNNQPSISELQSCSETYFAGTDYYDACVTIIQNSDPSTLNGQCVAGYCSFVRCIRRLNSDLLISQCYRNASVDNALELEEEQIRFYKNVTSCILANSRCLSINPITGQRQTNTFTSTSYNKYGKPVTTTVPLHNTLQINRAGDLRVIALPGTTTIQTYLCPYELNLIESSWNNLNC